MSWMYGASMKLILSHRTMAFAALNLKVRKKILECKCFEAVPMGHLPQISKIEAEDMIDFLDIDERLCAVSAKGSSHPDRSLYFTRQLYAGLPEDLLVPLSEEVYGLRPELVFLQMASELSLIELIRFGYDLCGSYIPGHGKKDTLYEQKPLTTVKAIRSFLSRCNGTSGLVKATRAAKYLKDSSASPQESNLAIRFILPFKLGGYNAPPFVLNGLFSKANSRRWPDLYWKQLAIDMEYNSDEFHLEITRDAIRSNQLQAKDLKVLTVTKEMTGSLLLMDRTAQDFYDMAGIRFRPRVKDYEKRKRELHHVLMSREWYKRLPEGSYRFSSRS